MKTPEEIELDQYKAWLESQNQKYQVFYNNDVQESPILNSEEECEKWVSENLPLGIQKCRTGCYYIEKV